jgi:hypothetical protein
LIWLAQVGFARIGLAGGGAVRGPQSTVHSPQSTVHSPQSTVHSPQSTVHSPQSTVHSPQGVGKGRLRLDGAGRPVWRGEVLPRDRELEAAGRSALGRAGGAERRRFMGATI